MAEDIKMHFHKLLYYRRVAVILITGLALCYGASGEAVCAGTANAMKAQKFQDMTVRAPLSQKVDLLLVGAHGEVLSLAPDNGSEAFFEKSDHQQGFRPGHPYLLHVWATWCSPCREELPHLAAFLKRHPEIPVIPLAMDSGSPVKVAGFTGRMGLADFPVWITDRKELRVILSQVPEPGLPMTLLVDGQGHIRAVSDGSIDWAAKDAESRIENWLGRVEDPGSREDKQK